MIKNVLLAIMTLGLLASCSNDDDTTVANNPEEVIVNPQPQNNPILQLVNAYRKAGCMCGSTYYPPVNLLTYNNVLEKAALKHSTDMKNNGFFSHTGSDGSTVGTRVTTVGYNWRTVGENIANGYTTNEAVVQGWINSPGHCVNIMNGAFKEMGVGRVGNYWTQNFGTKL